VTAAAARYDAGVRLGEQVAKDMIAVRIGPDFRMAVVGAPSYFAARPKPKVLQDLTAHACINLRLPTYDSVYAWEFEKRGRALKCGPKVSWYSVTSRCASTRRWRDWAWPICPSRGCRRMSPMDRLIRVLADWCPPFSGYHLYYPSRRQPAPAFALLVHALRYRGASR
jgi:DNA-binding transcriptional LysR family regulator